MRLLCCVLQPNWSPRRHQESFLARQSAHKAHQDKHRVIPNGLIAGLRPAPLLPLMHASGYHIQGSVYTEADWRNKRQHGKSPTWAKMDEGFAKPDLDTKFLGFLQRQNEALARRDKRVNGSAQVVNPTTARAAGRTVVSTRNSTTSCQGPCDAHTHNAR